MKPASDLLEEAIAACQQGRFADGVELFRKTLGVAPDHAAAHNLLGRALKELGRPDEALQSFDRAIALAPDFAEALFNRANLLSGQKRLEQAIASYDRAVALAPDFAAAWCNRGIALYELERHEEALASYDRALALAPDFAAAHSNRGNALKALKRLEDAILSFDRALALRPDLAETHSNRGSALRELDRYEEAVASYDRALALQPNYAEALFNRGKALHDLKRDAEALANLDRALALKPNFAEAHSARARSYIALGRIADARADRERTLALEPDNHDYAFDLALLQLLQGDWRAGWSNHERRERKKSPVYVPLPFPRWTGTPPAGESLVLLAEQGAGDMIQFARFAPYLAARGHRVSLVVNPKLAALLGTLRGIERVIAPPLKFEQENGVLRWLPLMSVPHVLGLGGDIPADVPYLAADSQCLESWRDRLGAHGFRIGIAWQGNPSYSDDDRRSIPLSAFAPLAEIPGVRLISLQLGFGSEQIESVAFRDRIERLGDAFDAGPSSFLDTAAAMMQLDLVISSDTGIAHLAGALARPGFVALSRVPDWRWLLDRDDSPWYPSLRLFRQVSPGAWNGVFERIAAAVRERMSHG